MIIQDCRRSDNDFWKGQIHNFGYKLLELWLNHLYLLILLWHSDRMQLQMQHLPNYHQQCNDDYMGFGIVQKLD